MTTQQIIAKVAANQLNGYRAIDMVKRSGEYTNEIGVKIGEAMDAAFAARNASDGYMRSES